MLQLARFAAASALSLALGMAPATAAVIDINGGASWAGWSAAGNAQNASSYVQGSATRNYQMYRADFTLEAAQTLGSSANVGDTSTSLFSGSWQAGDHILGLGLRYGGGQSGSYFFFHLDMAGDSIQSASELGGSVGNYSANAGDTSAYFTGGASGSNKFRNLTYSVFNAYTPDGSNNFTVPYGSGGNLNAPGRGFAVLAPSSTSSVGSAQFFFNLSAMARGNGGAGFGEGTYGNSSRVGFFESGSAGTAQVFSQQVFANSSAVPLPAGAPLLLGALGVLLRRSRRAAVAPV